VGRARSAPGNAAGTEAVAHRKRVEVEQLRATEREARRTEAFLSASVDRMMESRDQWRREAERLRALIAQVTPWSLFWWHCVNAFKRWRDPLA
jgi:chromosome condensin MukBEF ATPase and DNA-binding subunit MukB